MNRWIPATLLCALLTACGEPIKLNPPPPPASWLQCAPMPETPALDPLSAYPAEDNGLIYRKGDVDARDSVIARYIIALRGAHFDCANALQKVADYYAEQE